MELNEKNFHSHGNSIISSFALKKEIISQDKTNGVDTKEFIEEKELFDHLNIYNMLYTFKSNNSDIKEEEISSKFIKNEKKRSTTYSSFSSFSTSFPSKTSFDFSSLAVSQIKDEKTDSENDFNSKAKEANYFNNYCIDDTPENIKERKEQEERQNEQLQKENQRLNFEEYNLHRNVHNNEKINNSCTYIQKNLLDITFDLEENFNNYQYYTFLDSEHNVEERKSSLNFEAFTNENSIFKTKDEVDFVGKETDLAKKCNNNTHASVNEDKNIVVRNNENVDLKDSGAYLKSPLGENNLVERDVYILDENKEKKNEECKQSNVLQFSSVELPCLQCKRPYSLRTSLNFDDHHESLFNNIKYDKTNNIINSYSNIDNAKEQDNTFASIPYILFLLSVLNNNLTSNNSSSILSYLNHLISCTKKYSAASQSNDLLHSSNVYSAEERSNDSDSSYLHDGYDVPNIYKKFCLNSNELSEKDGSFINGNSVLLNNLRNYFQRYVSFASESKETQNMKEECNNVSHNNNYHTLIDNMKSCYDNVDHINYGNIDSNINGINANASVAKNIVESFSSLFSSFSSSFSSSLCDFFSSSSCDASSSSSFCYPDTYLDNMRFVKCINTVNLNDMLTSAELKEENIERKEKVKIEKEILHKKYFLDGRDKNKFMNNNLINEQKEEKINNNYDKYIIKKKNNFTNKFNKSYTSFGNLRLAKNQFAESHYYNNNIFLEKKKPCFVSPPSSYSLLSRMYRVLESKDVLLLYRAVRSLYDDQIIPIIFNLKGRLQELHRSTFIKENILALCGMMPETYIISYSEAHKDDVLYLRVPPSNFAGWVDANDMNDVYDENMWNSFTEWLRLQMIKNTQNTNLCFFKGGRYRMAKTLQEIKLPFFEGFTLGMYIHVIQLAITKRKLLAYEDKVLKPVVTCASFTNAMLGTPDQRHMLRNCITDIEELKEYVTKLLQMKPYGFNISTLKKKIKLKYNKELCQTVFHCTKLIELMDSPAMKTVCTVDKETRHIKLPSSNMKQSNFSCGSASTHSFPVISSYLHSFPSSYLDSCGNNNNEKTNCCMFSNDKTLVYNNYDEPELSAKIANDNNLNTNLNCIKGYNVNIDDVNSNTDTIDKLRNFCSDF